LNDIKKYYLKNNKEQLSSSLKKKGVLVKKGENLGGAMKSRMFVLTADFLYYFEGNEGNLHQKGKIALLNAEVLDGKNDVTFYLKTPKRVYTMIAKTKEDTSDWKQILKTTIAEVNKQIKDIFVSQSQDPKRQTVK